MAYGYGYGVDRTARYAQYKAPIVVTIAVTSLNPFSATLTAPSGYAIVGGSATISIAAKPGSYGTAQTVAATVTGGLAGTITETTAGSVVAALVLAGWLDGDTPTISATVGVAVLSPELLPGIVSLYDASNISTLFQDSVGTTPVTAAGQSVGLMLATSGLTPGPGLVSNGNFASWSGGLPVGWSLAGTQNANNYIADAGGALRIVSDGTYTGLNQNIGAVTGRYYEVSFNVVSITGVAQISLGAGSGSAIQISSTGSKRAILRAYNSNIGVYRVVGSSVNAVIDNMSARELPGYHAVQDTAAARPTYWTTPGRVLFDGVDDYLSTGVVPSAAGTLAARFFVPSAAAGRTLIGAANADGKQILLYVSVSGYISAYGTGTAVIAAASGLVVGAWRTASMSWDASTVSLYLDGALVGGASQVSPVLVTYPFFIGARNAAGTANSLTSGSIGAAAIYDRVLNAAEHLQLHNAWSSIA